MKKRSECKHYKIVYCFYALDPELKWNYGIAPRCTAIEGESESCPKFEAKTEVISDDQKSNTKKD